ncbi:14746_t:CDS:2, partial [Dentiscutata heterogama]
HVLLALQMYVQHATLPLNVSKISAILAEKPIAAHHLQVLPTCSDECPHNYKCHVWKQDCFTCAQARCVPI